MKIIDDFPCDLEHPLFEIIDNQTRRHILRLLALEGNYGNQLASIIKLSAPAIHKHIKRLQYHENQHDSVGIISNTRSTHETYSGRKGGLADIYEVDTRLGLFFGIFPNYIHSQVHRLDPHGDPVVRDIDSQDFDPNLFGTEITVPCQDEEGQKRFEQRVESIKELNLEITELQESLMSALSKKDQLIKDVNEEVNQCELEFMHRMVLKALIAYGGNNLSLIASLLNSREEEIHHIIRQLRRQNWVKDREIFAIN